MKTRIFLALAITLTLTCAAQHRNLELIKEYYNSINRAEKIEQLYNEAAQRRIESTMRTLELEALSGIPLDSFDIKNLWRTLQHLECTVNRLKDRSERALVFFFPRTQGIKNFNFSKDINDFITIDTNQTRIVYFNRQSGEYIHLSGTNFGSSVFRPGRICFFSFVDKTKPDVLFVGDWLFRSNYLFMKDNKMFLYCRRTGKVYELNEFIHKNFEEERFIRLAALHEQGYAPFGSGSEPAVPTSTSVPIKQSKEK